MRKLTLTLTLLSVAACASAKEISPGEAYRIATDFFGTNIVTSDSPKNTIKRIKPAGVDDNQESTPYYVFNNGSDQGFVIVSGDDCVGSILGYSDKGNFNYENTPPQLLTLLERYKSEFKGMNKSAVSKRVKTNISKQNATSENEKVLATAQWGQGYPFNMYAQELNGEKCPSGCVATAMAIVMKYNNWPESGRGQHTWTCNGTELDYDFGNVSFNYSLMPDSYMNGTFNDQEAQEVAKLMQAAGAAVNMQYDPFGSGAMPCVIGHYMYEYFKYSPTCQYITAANFAYGEWLNMIYDQIDSNHPIIMSGNSLEVGGHAFVCDGYNGDEMLHINWGWDGEVNGFFDPILLGGFNYGIGMVINLFNDGNEKEYARCWNDYGYLWSTAGSGAGFNVSVENIKQNEPFKAIVGQITFPNDFEGVVCLALVDENENIIETNEEVSHRLEKNNDWDHIGYSWVGHGALPFTDAIFKSEIDPSMHVQAVAKEDGGEWKLILGTVEAPSSICVVNNKPSISQIEWRINDPNGIIEGLDNIEETILLGDVCSFEISTKGGVSYVLIDGVYRSNGSDFSINGFNFTASKSNHLIEIYANRYEDLLDRKIILEKAGELSSKILENERALIYRLTVEGPMNEDDYDFINNCLYSLKHLDVHNTTIESGSNRANYLPKQAGERGLCDGIGANVWGLESIILPDCLNGFEAYSMPHRSIEYLKIPKNVVDYEWNSVAGYAGSKLDFLKVDNPIPVEIEEESGALSLVYDGLYRNNTILFVPEGSKDAYLKHSSWRGFKDIRETNMDFSGEYIDYNGVRYLLLGDNAIASGIYASSLHRNYYVVPESVDHEGKRYKVSGNCRDLTTKYMYLDNVTDFEFNTASQRITAAVTPHISANYSGGKPSDFMELMIPGATSNHYKESNCNIVEMWNYSIDKEHTLLSIVPLQNCEIVEVMIGGEQAERVSDNLYYFHNVNKLEVVVKFNAFGLDHVMTTHYPADFNESLPSVDLKIPVEWVGLSTYDVSLKKNDTFRLEALVQPEYASDKSVTWSSDNPEVASVDTEGNVTALSMGTAVITATSNENPELRAYCTITVLNRTGDSNGDGVVDIADAVNLANYILGLETTDFSYDAADVNRDGKLTISDITSMIALIATQTYGTQAFNMPMYAKEITTGYLVSNTNKNDVRELTLDTNETVAALQFDITVSEGNQMPMMRLADKYKSSHSLQQFSISENAVRVIIFSSEGKALSSSQEEPIILLEGNVSENSLQYSNIFASKTNGQSMNLQFIDMGVSNGVISSSVGLPSVVAAQGGVSIYNLDGQNVAIYTMDGSCIGKYAPKAEKFELSLSKGLYIVTVGSQSHRIIIR